MGVVRPPSNGGGGAGLDVLTLENRSGSTIPAGYAVQGHPSGAGCEAWTGARPVLGIAAVDITPGLAGTVQRDGPLILLAWALTPSARYYCDPDAPGALTATPVIRDGVWVQCVGVALTDEILEVRVADPIRL